MSAELYHFPKKTIGDIDVEGKRILLRADFNVPLTETGAIDSDYRIVKTLPTIQYLLERHCEVVIVSHLGRPDGQRVVKYSLAPVAVCLRQLLGQEVHFLTDSVGDIVRQALKNKQPGKITLLENVRFYPGEEANDPHFAQQLKEASNPDYVVQDGFGVVHRAHASTESISRLVPAVAGQLLEQEVTVLSRVIRHPEKPLVAVLGGAKISDKIDLIERFVDLADTILIGGAMANTFFQYLKLPIGQSLWDDNEAAEIKRIIHKISLKTHHQANLLDSDFCILPTDVAVAQPPQTRRLVVDRREVANTESILDIGSETAQRFKKVISKAGTVIWNGTMGLAEKPQFAKGSQSVAEAMKSLKGKAETIIGGGDTADFVLEWDKTKGGSSFSHISTGGGASLELLSGKKLPGVEALLPR